MTTEYEPWDGIPKIFQDLSVDLKTINYSHIGKARQIHSLSNLLSIYVQKKKLILEKKFYHFS